MQSTAHQSIGANTLNPAADRIPAAAHLTVPKLRIPLTSVVEQGPETEVASLLTELSHRVDLSDILKRNHIANNALAESFRKWLNEFISPDVDRLLDLTVTLYPVQRKWYHNEYEVDGTLPKEDWIFQISMNHVDYYNFDISAQITGYEANNPGLGQYLLRTIDRCPYELGTPSYLFSIIRYFFWGDMENEWEFARELYGDCLSDLKCVLRDIRNGRSSRNKKESGISRLKSGLLRKLRGENTVSNTWFFHAAIFPASCCGRIPEIYGNVHSDISKKMS